MGWLDPEERKYVLKKYKMEALYRCNRCKKPINILEMPVVEPKGGYVSWKRKGTPKNIRSFVTKEPKETYHQVPCNYERLGKHKQLQKLKDKQKENEMPKSKKSKKETKSKKSSKSEKKEKKVKKENKTVHADKGVMKDVLSLIKKKENHYTKPRLFQKFKDKHEKKDVRAALSALWAKKTIRKTDNKYHLVAA